MRRLFAVFSAVIAMVALASCSSVNPGWMELSGVKAEYEETTKSLTWPSGYSWRSADEIYKDETEPATYEAGYGAGDAGIQWLCAWEQELLDAVDADSKVRQQSAIEMLAKLPTLEAWKTFDDGLQKSETEKLTKAKLGDFSDVATDVEANCSSS
jgi:hypothetical protein